MEQPRTRRERREMERALAEQARQKAQSETGADSFGEATEQMPRITHDAPATPRPFIRPAEPNVSAQNYPDGTSGQYANANTPHWDADQTQPFQAVATSTQAPVHQELPSRKDVHSEKRKQPERQPLGFVRGTIRTFGELCITAGLVMILFVAWQLWWTDIEANRDNEDLASSLITKWKDNPRDELPKDPDTPIVAKVPEENQAFGIMYVPRFGDDYYRTIAEGVQLEPVLNRMGMGHYPSTARPGEVGNFAMAGHRVTYGKPLNQIAELRPGDPIVIQTQEGFYTYTMRNFDIILPDQTEVLAPVPSAPKYKGKERLMTLTACNPMFSARERYVIYAELTEWRPAAEGPPKAIKDSAAFKKAGGQ